MNRHQEPEDRARQLRAALERAIAATPAEALLLSGGIDSSLLAALDPRPVAITVVLEGGECSRKCEPAAGCERCVGSAAFPEGCGRDLACARAVARHLGLRWEAVVLGQDAALDALGDLVRLTRSFDLGLLNDIPIYAGLRHARSLGLKTAWTGDDADSLFGGYRFLRTETDWGAYLDRRLPTISPPSARIGAALGMEVRYPYLHSEVVAVARTLTRADVEEWREGRQAGSFVDQFDDALMGRRTKPWGKAVLRRAAAGLVPDQIAWRPKTDLQFGSGMCRLEGALAATVDARVCSELDGRGLRFFNDAHRGVYLLFERAGLQIAPPSQGEYACSGCGSGVRIGRAHCRTCGAYPVGDGSSRVMGPT